MISSAPSIDALWLETLQRVSSRIAHELRGALNGVSVNLEVVRSRATRTETPASAVASFATAASEQFDGVMDMAEALLALSRPAPETTDPAATTAYLVALLAPVAKADGRSLRIEGGLDAIGPIAAGSSEPSAVRLAIGAVLLAAMESAADVACRARTAALVVVHAGDEPLALPADDVIAALKDTGIEIQAEPSAISITFPR